MLSTSSSRLAVSNLAVLILFSTLRERNRHPLSGRMASRSNTRRGRPDKTMQRACNTIAIRVLLKVYNAISAGEPGPRRTLLDAAAGKATLPLTSSRSQLCDKERHYDCALPGWRRNDGDRRRR